MPSASAVVRNMVSALVWSRDCSAGVLGKPWSMARALGGVPTHPITRAHRVRTHDG